MPAESIEQVVSDIRSMLNLAAAAHAFATNGISLVLEQFGRLPGPVPENPDPTVYLGVGHPQDPSSRQYASYKASEIPGVMAHNGPIIRQLGHEWAVFVFAEWETTLRGRLAAASGRDYRQIQVDLFGDLRRLRNDILHSAGVATKQETGEIRVLRWFSVGNAIVIKHEHVADFMLRVPWDELRSLTVRPAT